MVVCDQPVAGDEPTAWPQHPEHVDRQRFLVGDVHDRILAEHDVDTGVVERERAGRHLPDLDPVGETMPLDALPGACAHQGLDVEPDHPPGTVVADQGDRGAARPAPDVDHGRAREIDTGDRAGDLIGPARRQEPVAPQLFEEGDLVFAVQRFVSGIAHAPACISRGSRRRTQRYRSTHGLLP